MKLSGVSKKIIKPIAFLAVLAILVLVIQSRVFKINDSRSYQTFKGFYAEPKNSLDMVYIGQSNVYPFWNAPLCWENYGFTTYPLAIGAMPARSVKYVLEEAVKTQPEALYLINLNSFTDIRFNVSHLHNVADYMKMSSTKSKMIEDLIPYLGDEQYSKLEFYLPIVRFHPGWNELTDMSFDLAYNGLKGGSIYSTFLGTTQDVTESYRVTDNRVALSDDQRTVLEDLAEYIDNNDIKVLFVTVPQAIANESVVAQLNSASDMLEEKGFDVLDMEQSIDELGLNLSTDYYNEQHLNIHGCIKFTKYLSEYLKSNYDFEDKREKSGYDSWHKAAEDYHEVIAPYTLDLEFDTESRDYSIEAAKPTMLVATGESFYLGWEEADSCDGYEVYRRYLGNELYEAEDIPAPWEKVGDVKSGVKAFVDEGLELFGKYAYTIVGYKNKGGKKVYGKFDYYGIEAVTRINPPEILSFEHGEDGNTITWSPVEGVDGYAVVRRIDGQKFLNIAEVPSDVLTYTDAFYQEGVSYTYSVCGYMDITDNVDDRRYGYYDSNGPKYVSDAIVQVSTEGGGD